MNAFELFIENCPVDDVARVDNMLLRLAENGGPPATDRVRVEHLAQGMGHDISTFNNDDVEGICSYLNSRTEAMDLEPEIMDMATDASIKSLEFIETKIGRAHYMLLNRYSKEFLIYGAVQCNKTVPMMSLALRAVMMGFRVVFMVRDLNGDSETMVRKLNEFAVMHGTFVGDGNFPSVSLDTNRSNALLDFVQSTSLDHKGHAIVLQANKSQLKNFIQHGMRNKFFLFVDEADEIVNKRDIPGEENVSNMVEEIRHRSYKMAYTSATPGGILFGEKQHILGKNVLYVKQSDNYRGLIGSNRITTRQVIHETKNRYAASRKKSIFDCDPYAKTWIRHVAELEPSHKSIGSVNGMPEEDHPIIAMVMNSTDIMHHAEIANYINEDIFLSPRLTTITNDGKTKINGKGLKHFGFNLVINKMKGTRIAPGHYSFPGLLHIQHALQFLRDNGASRAFPRILIIAGKTAGRAVNYATLDYKYHLTHLYLRPARTVPCHNLMQYLRILGIQMSHDTTPWELFISSAVFESIKKFYDLQTILIDKAVAAQEELCFDTLESLSVSKTRLPQPKLAQVPVPFRVVCGPDNLVDGELGVEFEIADEIERFVVDTNFTPSELEIYDLVYHYLVNNDMTNRWLRRAEIIIEIVTSERRPVAEARLKDIYQKRCTSTIPPNFHNIKFKKENGEIHMWLEA